MKKRISRVLNFLAFNLLFFALYLNFIHKDNNELPDQANATASIRTVLVSNQGEYVKKDVKLIKPTEEMQN